MANNSFEDVKLSHLRTADYVAHEGATKLWVFNNKRYLTYKLYMWYCLLTLSNILTVFVEKLIGLSFINKISSWSSELLK